MCVTIWAIIALITLIFNFGSSTYLSTKTGHADSSSKKYCALTAGEAEQSPWTATIKLSIPSASGTSNYFAGVILDAHTVVTCGKAFHALTDKMQFLPWDTYTINAGPFTKNGTEFIFDQSVQVSFIQPHPKYNGDWNDAYWVYSENFYIIIHLKDPLIFTDDVKPVCLPEILTESELSKLVVPGTTVLMGGWIKSPIELEKTSINVLLSNDHDCYEEWKRRGFTSGQTVLPYKNRACGYSMERTENNPHAQCIDKNSGAFVKNGDSYTFIGFLNSYYSVLDLCDKDTFVFIYRTSVETFQWIQNTMKCGSFNYTCHNGECVSLDTVCNQKQDGCSDGSDENPLYCRALVPCKNDEFACGVYGKCIPKVVDGKVARNCDGVKDCEFGEDENPELCRKPDKPATGPILIGVGTCLALVILVVGLLLIGRRFRRKQDLLCSFTKKDDRQLETDITEAHDNQIHETEEMEDAKMYDTSAYEIPLERIVKGAKIGSGQFGDIYKAELLDLPNQRKACALKILKTSTDADQMKAVFKELKIMIHVGENKNLVKFIGASTSQIRNRVVHIVLEYCEFGSMEKFLRSNDRCFVNTDSNVLNSFNDASRTSPPNYVFCVEAAYMFGVKDLIRWASEIAEGMTYLGSKYVIHGDLAARNVLIDSFHLAKIADFGLSRAMYTSSASYVLSADSRLPWKWMGPETLRYGTLSTKSDVWSYGVTLWELFTLGAVPYGGLEWSQWFVDMICSTGSSLKQPVHASSKIFELMNRCWAMDPNERPNFAYIKSYLNDILVERN